MTLLFCVDESREGLRQRDYAKWVPGTPEVGFGSQPFKMDMRFGSASAADFLINLYRRTGDKTYLNFARRIIDDILNAINRE